MSQPRRSLAPKLSHLLQDNVSQRPPDNAEAIVHTPLSDPKDRKLTSEEVKAALAAEKVKQLRGITTRNRARDQNNTTALHDLSLARLTNVVPDSTIETPWTMDQQHVFVGQIRNYTDQSWMHPACSQDTLVPAQVSRSRLVSGTSFKPVDADVEADANAWGSPVPSDGTQATSDPVRALYFGRLFRNKEPAPRAHTLIGFDGKMQPPPLDWNERPRFNNNNPEYRNTFVRWTAEVVELTCGVEGTMKLVHISSSQLANLKSHPDGLGMVARDFTVDKNTAFKYGYSDIADATKYAHRTDLSAFEDWGKLDPSKPENKYIAHETTEWLVKNWIENMYHRRMVQAISQDGKGKTGAEEHAMVQQGKPGFANRPILNIYLRPSVKADNPQITAIYNYHVEHSCRPPELDAVPEEDMRDRISGLKADKLPLIVAVARSNKTSTPALRTPAMVTQHAANQPFKRSGPSTTAAGCQECIVGFACAQDFTAADYVERITAELEIYVEPRHRQMGVGSALMDQILESLDSSYTKRGSYDFHCAPELRHLYRPGGERDIHKIVLIVRKYAHPNAPSGQPVARTALSGTSTARLNDGENDFELWSKAWLETWGFKLEACLSRVGARKGRYIDTVYMTRETGWAPDDGQIPNAPPNTY